MAIEQCMLTTIDNPYDPYEDWDKWYQWDEAQGYHTCAYLARVAGVSTEDQINNEEFYEYSVTKAIDEICEFNILGIYRKVYPKKGEEK